MMVKFAEGLLSVLCYAAAVRAQECPELPGGVEVGPGYPPDPNDIPSGCSAFEILVARGTSEPNFEPEGKFGIVVGDPVVSNATLFLPGVRGYPVQYPASSSVIIGGIEGRRDIVSRLRSQSLRCPSQKFALVGYSQGASIMHRAAEEIPSYLYSKIVAIAMFGDPDLRSSRPVGWPAALRPKVLQSCAPGDPACDPSGDCFYWHLIYIRPEWINRAVNWIVNAFRGTPLPPTDSLTP